MRLISALIFLCFVSCSGGSGVDVPFFGGVWSLTLVKTLDSCGATPESVFSGVWTVNQEDTRIVVDSPGVLVLEGVLSGNGFLAVVTSENCGRSELEFSDLDGNKAQAVLTVGVGCGFRCVIQFQGVAERL